MNSGVVKDLFMHNSCHIDTLSSILQRSIVHATAQESFTGHSEHIFYETEINF